MMPQRVPARKITCKDCGWTKKEKATTIGDCRTGKDMLRTMPVKECPKCGSSNVETKQAPKSIDDPFGLKRPTIIDKISELLL